MFARLLVYNLVIFAVHSNLVPNDLENMIPDEEYLKLVAGKTETLLHKIDSDTSLCGRYGIDVREITILELQEAFHNKLLTSKELVKCYLKRITLMNPHLNAVLETNHEAIAIAERLDQERDAGVNYGPLHGIPILVKDTIGTNDGMENTGGSVALLGLKPKYDSAVVKMLRKAGAIIIGKANLSEFGNFRGSDMPNGWSGRGGKTRSAYNTSEDPFGSSSGSAVATAANLATVALGGETVGSIIAPAEAAGLIGLKTTWGRVPIEGTIGITKSQDVIGPMTRTVNDAAILFNAISKDGFQGHCFSTKRGLEGCDTPKKKFKVGVLRQPAWDRCDPNQLKDLEEILVQLPDIGINVEDPVQGPNDTSNTSISSYRSESIVLMHEFKAGLNDYLRDEVQRPNSNNSITSLADMIAFNEQHPPKEGFNQIYLTEAEATDGLHNKTYLEHRMRNKASVQDYIDFIFGKYDLDAIVVPTRSCWWYSCTYPAVAGYPHITMPVGFSSNGVPFGISFYGKPNSEETLLTIAYKLEKVHRIRRPPLFLN